MKKKIAIIGAGPSGLAQLRSFAAAQEKGDSIPEIVCFEKQDDWGGLWNYSWRTGLDQYGEAVHGSMYRYLWSNGPKECLEFADYTFEEHFGHPIASYPPRAVLWDYIKGRVEKSDVRKYIRFSTVVRNVEYDETTKIFTVKTHNLKNDIEHTDTFDAVIVAVGHFSTPNIPQFDGFNTFGGRVLHAHDFRDALEFKGKDILILGSSYSAEDIGSQCYKYGCKSITVSYRTGAMGYNWPDNWQEVPLLLNVKGKTAYFADGTSKDVDAIILCTGYLHHYPFLPDKLRLKSNNRMWPKGLYQGIFWNSNPDLIYLGAQDQYYTFNMFDAQAWYARDYILGKISMPNQSAIDESNKYWEDREANLATAKDEIYFQGDYVTMLLKEVDYPQIDIEGVNKAFVEWKHHKKDSIMGYRNNRYKSLVTGTLSPLHHTAWIDAMDDSLESYLNIEQK